MQSLDTLILGDRTFSVTRAVISIDDGVVAIEIETERGTFDGESWAPYLYHQGLRSGVSQCCDLVGSDFSWRGPNDADYVHPEKGLLYVFGHHLVRDSTLSFRGLTTNHIELQWVGSADVLWDEHYAENVAFSCCCRAEIGG
jgi:hypothetical protein